MPTDAVRKALGLPLLAAGALSFLLACRDGGDRAPAEPRAPAAQVAADTPAAPPLAKVPSAKVVADTPAARPSLRYLSGFDDEGILEAPVPSPSGPGPHYVDGVLYADAVAVAALLAPGTGVSEAEGMLTLAGQGTGIPALRYGVAVYAPARTLARRLGAYTHEAEGSATFWPRERLCEYLARRPDPRAAVYRGALAEGLFAGCPPAAAEALRS